MRTATVYNACAIPEILVSKEKFLSEKMADNHITK